MALLLLLLSIISLIFQIVCSEVINLEDGPLQGQLLKSREQKPYYSFTGIPFAKPPVGDLRYKEPQPINSWNETLDATKPPKMCIQLSNIFIEEYVIMGEEDCLYINVYSPKLDGKLPVLFWIHGGGFTVGYSGSSLYGPEYFMDKDVVLVTTNYRLGFLGFLSTDDGVLPGNLGMKDQVMALRWVKKNIGQFGGNPDQVTIFGESAGGASVGHHLLSPMSKGLFHKAIVQSGSPLCKWGIAAPGMAYNRTLEVAKMVGCKTDSSKDILICLKSLKASDIIELYPKFFKWKTNPIVVFSPTVEICNSNAFLCQNPMVNFKQESNVPVIIGVNSAEGGFFVSSLFNETALLYPELNSDFNRLVSITLMYESFTQPTDIEYIGESILKKYFPSGKIDDESHLKAVEMFGDSFFVHGVLDFASKLSSPVYFYLFDYQNSYSFNQMFGNCQKSLGVTHADDLTLLFNTNGFTKKDLNKQEIEVSKTMVNIWSQFASTNILTINGQSNGEPWPKFTTIEDSLIIHLDSPNPKIKKNPFVHTYQFWQELPLLSSLETISPDKSFQNNVKNEL